jgi:hypothetical protein
MAGKSPATTSDEQRTGLLALAGSRDRDEAIHQAADALNTERMVVPLARPRVSAQ